MEKILESLNQYEILTCLVPGMVFCQLTDWFYGTEIIAGNSVSLLIEGYIFGQMISRTGSLIVEPMCKKLKVIVMAPYDNWRRALEKDDR